MYARKAGPFIAPSSTNGATIPSCRKPATKVIVFQCPCGTDATSRWPRGQRPLSRTMFVLVAVSSINTSRAGSSKPCSRIQRRRARATSARFCSSACRLFFKADIVSIKEPLQRALTAADSLFGHGGKDLLEGQIRLFGNQSQKPFRVLFERRGALPPLGLASTLPVSLQRRHHRITELTPTSNTSATSRRDAPLSTASTARSRKSVEYGFGIDLAPRRINFSRFARAKAVGNPPDSMSPGNALNLRNPRFGVIPGQCAVRTYSLRFYRVDRLPRNALRGDRRSKQIGLGWKTRAQDMPLIRGRIDCRLAFCRRGRSVSCNLSSHPLKP